jgi:hypothetical protein
LRDHLLMDMYVNAWLWCIGTASINIGGITELMSPWAHPLKGKIVPLALSSLLYVDFFHYIINIYCNLSTIKVLEESWDLPCKRVETNATFNLLYLSQRNVQGLVLDLIHCFCAWKPFSYWLTYSQKSMLKIKSAKNWCNT